MSYTMQMWMTHRDYVKRSNLVRLTTPHWGTLGWMWDRLPHSWQCRQNGGNIVKCVIRSMFTWSWFWHIWPNRKSNLTLTPNPNGKVQDIDVPTFDIRNIEVLKVDVVEVDLPEQSTCCKLTIKNHRLCGRFDILGVDLLQLTSLSRSSELFIFTARIRR